MKFYVLHLWRSDENDGFLENYFSLIFIFRKVSEKSVIYCTTCFVDTKKRHKMRHKLCTFCHKNVIFSFLAQRNVYIPVAQRINSKNESPLSTVRSRLFHNPCRWLWALFVLYGFRRRGINTYPLSAGVWGSAPQILLHNSLVVDGEPELYI